MSAGLTQRAALLLTGLLAIVVACARPSPVSESRPALPAGADPEARCIPDFPYSEGWMGGDAAYSVSLPASRAGEHRRTLWLFGDSFVGPPGQTDRVDSTFVHNTIGVSRCTEQGFEIDYVWSFDAEGEPRAFFDSDSQEQYWWLFDGFVHGGKLYVGLLEVEPAAPEETLQMPFRVVGLRLARVENPTDPPGKWSFVTSQLSRSTAASLGAAMTLAADHVYIYAFKQLDAGRQPRFLTRLRLDLLDPFPEDLTAALETWVDDGRWEVGFLPDRAAILMVDSASEMSVEYHDELGRWLAIYGAPVQTDAHGRAAPIDGPPSDRVFLRTAARPEGPWSERTVLFRIPELSAAGNGPEDPNTVCYAAKGHLEFAPPRSLFITYVCNLRTQKGEDPWSVLGRLVRNMSLYRPRPVVLPLPDHLRER